MLELMESISVFMLAYFLVFFLTVALFIYFYMNSNRFICLLILFFRWFNPLMHDHVVELKCLFIDQDQVNAILFISYITKEQVKENKQETDWGLWLIPWCQSS